MEPATAGQRQSRLTMRNRQRRREPNPWRRGQPIRLPLRNGWDTAGASRLERRQYCPMSLAAPPLRPVGVAQGSPPSAARMRVAASGASRGLPARHLMSATWWRRDNRRGRRCPIRVCQPHPPGQPPKRQRPVGPQPGKAERTQSSASRIPSSPASRSSTRRHHPPRRPASPSLARITATHSATIKTRDSLQPPIRPIHRPVLIGSRSAAATPRPVAPGSSADQRLVRIGIATLHGRSTKTPSPADRHP